MAKRKSTKTAEPKLWELDARALADEAISLCSAAESYRYSISRDGTKNRGATGRAFENLVCHLQGMRSKLKRLGITHDNIPARLSLKERSKLIWKVKRHHSVRIFESTHMLEAILQLLPALADVFSLTGDTEETELFSAAELPEIPAKLNDRLERLAELATDSLKRLDGSRFEVKPADDSQSAPTAPAAAEPQEQTPDPIIPILTICDRDQLFLEWYEAKGEPTHHSPATIRDRWNRENPKDTISDPKTKQAGADIVKKGIARAKKKPANGQKS